MRKPAKNDLHTRVRATALAFFSLLFAGVAPAQEPEAAAVEEVPPDTGVLIVATPLSGPAPLEVQFDADVVGEGVGRQESDGLVVLEAEHYSLSSPRQDPAGIHWTTQSGAAGFGGDGYVVATGTSAENGEWESASELRYGIEFASAGEFRVWVRRWAPDGASNSVFVGLADEAVGVIDNEHPSPRWRWVRGGVITIADPGHRELTIRRRETGYAIDRIVLVKNADYVPSGTGPPESRRARRIDYDWSFGDGTTSAEPSPVHCYDDPGSYVVELAATELGVTGRGSLRIEVGERLPVNRAPTVSAGVGTAVSGRRMQLNGFVADDGLPTSEQGVITLWALVEGPGDVKWLDPELERTTATFSAPGTYVLALYADDGEYLVGHTLTVVVE